LNKPTWPDNAGLLDLFPQSDISTFWIDKPKKLTRTRQFSKCEHSIAIEASQSFEVLMDGLDGPAKHSGKPAANIE